MDPPLIIVRLKNFIQFQLDNARMRPAAFLPEFLMAKLQPSLSFDCHMDMPPVSRPVDPAPVLDKAGWLDLEVETSHARIAVRQSRSSGLPFVFLHGLGTSSEVFRRQFESPLSQTHRLVLIDLPGHGDSSDAYEPAQSYTLAGYADCVSEVLEHLDCDQVVLVGWSLGGHVAMELLTRYPGVVGLLLIGAPPIGRLPAHRQHAFMPHPARELMAQADLSDEDQNRLATALVGADHAERAAAAMWRMDALARPSLMTSLVSGQFEDEEQALIDAEVPVAIVGGADDPLVDRTFLAQAKRYAVWGRKCHLLPCAGHAPFLEAPQLFNPIFSAFARDMGERARHMRDNPWLCLGA
jgi:pimeloyl-ACP methyl ester carboxylesterase